MHCGGWDNLACLLFHPLDEFMKANNELATEGHQELNGAPQQEAEALHRAERSVQAKQQLLDQLQEQLTQETAAGSALRAQVSVLEGQLRDARANSHTLQALVQVCHAPIKFTDKIGHLQAVKERVMGSRQHAETFAEGHACQGSFTVEDCHVLHHASAQPMQNRKVLADEEMRLA